MIENLTQRWRRCGQREQWLLMLCAAVLLLFFSQHLLLSPLYNWRQQQQQGLEQAQRDLQWIQSQQSRIETLQQQPTPPPTEALPSLLQRSASEMNVPFSLAKNGVLTLPPQPFSPLLAWLAQLELRDGMQVRRLSLQMGQSGQLTGELEFKHD
ncbi:type II secretion system protein GspM [Cedecea sp.]|jgi:type II secretory pathway component PulM|uniref:type II secretion system protein GspM n=1 Tax=Cedecea sp. TaxID=1970739 RepID=UPI002F42FD06